MDVDIAQVQYFVELITETGDIYELDNAIQTLAWEEQEGQLAQKATITLSSHSTENGALIRSLLKINRIIRIHADWGAGVKKLFEGTIWEWQYSRSAKQDHSIVIYDPMIRLQQSKDFYYFSAGMSTPAILNAICGEWGVTVDYQWSQQITHEKKVFNCETVSDMIIKLLEEVRQQTGTQYAVIYKDGKLVIEDYGTNTDVYLFDYPATISTSDKLSMNNLVTRVKILGKADDNGRSSVEAVIDGNLDFGVLQEVIRRDDDKDIGKAKTEAEQTLKERGKPEESIMVTSADLPFLRKGDAVEMQAGNLSGIFCVLGVSHNATTKQMTMTLMRQPVAAATGGKKQEEQKQDTGFKKGDAIILNGPVYVDSYGNGKGRTFTNYKSTITIVAPLDRPCPYHVGGIGWVYPNEITKA